MNAWEFDSVNIYDSLIMALINYFEQ